MHSQTFFLLYNFVVKWIFRFSHFKERKYSNYVIDQIQTSKFQLRDNRRNRYKENTANRSKWRVKLSAWQTSPFVINEESISRTAPLFATPYLGLPIFSKTFYSTINLNFLIILCQSFHWVSEAFFFFFFF